MMCSINGSLPDLSFLVRAVDSTSTESVGGGNESNWIKTIADTLSIESVLHLSETTLSNIISVTKDSTFGVLSLISTVSACRRCLDSGVFSMDALVLASSGFSAIVSLGSVAETAIGISVGIAELSGVAGSFVTLATFATKVQQKDVPGALLTGTKFIATIALAGHPVALGVVVAANVAYNLYCTYHAYYAAGNESPSLENQADGHPVDQGSTTSLLEAIQERIADMNLESIPDQDLDLSLLDAMHGLR
jgi:hypothetical protein